MEQQPTKANPLQLLDLHDDALVEICQTMHGVAFDKWSCCAWSAPDECRTCSTLLKVFSSTCKRLRSLASPLIFRRCSFGPQCPMQTSLLRSPGQFSNLTFALGFAQRHVEAANHVREITFDASELCDPLTSGISLGTSQIEDVAKNCAKSLPYFTNLQTLRVILGDPGSSWGNTNLHLALIIEFEKSFRQNCPQKPSLKTLNLDRDPGNLLTAFPNINDLTIHGECDYITKGPYVSPYFQQLLHPPRLQRLELLTTWSAPLLEKILKAIPTLRVLSMPTPTRRSPRDLRVYLDDFETFLRVLEKHSNLEILQLDKNALLRIGERRLLSHKFEADARFRKKVFASCRSLELVQFGDDGVEFRVERNQDGSVHDVRIIRPPSPPVTIIAEDLGGFFGGGLWY